MLIGLTGKKEVGKDTTYNRIYHLYHEQIPVERIGFADLIYVTGAEALGVSVENLHAWKSNPRIKIYVVEEAEHAPLTLPPLHELTVRQYLQRYGQAHRSAFGPAFWEDQILPTLLDHRDSILVVTDLRMPAEAELIRSLDGVVVRVHGSSEDQWDLHPTEKSLPTDLINEHIYNTVKDDDFKHLDGQVKKLMRKLLK